MHVIASRALFLLLLAAASRGYAGVTYRFVETATGTYAKHQEGRVIVDGAMWRLDYDVDPTAVTYLTAIISSGDGDLIALNDTRQTWYRLKSRAQLQPNASLFTFGTNVTVSKIRVTVAPDGASRNTGASETRVSFSYRITTKLGTEKVHGDVWGEIRVWSAGGENHLDLPWKPLDVHTGIDSVDAALKGALSGVRGTVWQSEMELSRRLDRGAILHQVITRSMGAVAPAASRAGQFVVPATYTYEEPVIGSPSQSAAASSPPWEMRGQVSSRP